MKTKKFAKDTFTFETKEEIKQDEQDFVELMENNGVKPLVEKKSDLPTAHIYNSRAKEIKVENIVQENLISTHKFCGSRPELSPLKRKPKKKVKINRQFKPDVRIDLHGLTRETALKKVESIIPMALRNNCQTILVITGKGLHSGEEKGVLRSAVWGYLDFLFQERKISDFKWAPPFLGGEGAILIFI